MKDSLVSLREGYLAMLRSERGSSAHTLRAYERELAEFVAYLTKQFGERCDIRRIEHLHIRAYLAAVVWARIVEGLGRAGACCGAVMVQVAGAHGARSAEPGGAGGDAEAAEASAAGADD